MLKNNWKNFCIVGNGHHVADKIIPALINEKKNILGLVTSKKKEFGFDFAIFDNISSSLEKLPFNTVYIIATPPNLHFRQAKEILENKRDVIIEKPIFITLKEAKEIYLSKDPQNIVLEGFMHKYTRMYLKFMKYWEINKEHIVKLRSEFYIPEIPKGTFRDGTSISSSCLYDMGCYGLSLLNDIGLNLEKLKVKEFEKIESKILKIKLTDIIDNIIIEINFGKSNSYANFVEITKSDNEKINFSPFFYGRKAKKSIIHFKNNDIILNKFNDWNAFEKMFSQNLQNLYLNHENRFKKIFVVTKKLEELSTALK